MLEHFTTFGEKCSTMLNGRPHGSIFVGQHVSTKSINAVQQKSHRVNGALEQGYREMF